MGNISSIFGETALKGSNYKSYRIRINLHKTVLSGRGTCKTTVWSTFQCGGTCKITILDTFQCGGVCKIMVLDIFQYGGTCKIMIWGTCWEWGSTQKQTDSSTNHLFTGAYPFIGHKTLNLTSIGQQNYRKIYLQDTNP